MTAAGRVAAVLVGLAAIVAGSAALVREIVLAADSEVTWTLNDSVTDLSGDTSWLLPAAAGVAAGITILLVVLAVREFTDARRGPLIIEFAAEEGRASVDVAALARAIRRHLESQLPGVRTRALYLGKSGDGWIARLEADLPARDLRGSHRRAWDIVAFDLARTGGMQLARLDIVARRLELPGRRPA